MDTLDAAREYVGGGISIFPVRADGSKAPDGTSLPRRIDPADGKLKPTWNPFREAPPTDADLVRWFGVPDPPGIAAVCGAVSGGLELIDFDNDVDAAFAAWCEAIVEIDETLPPRICVVRSPKPGWHVWFRSEVRPVPGNSTLAADPGRPKREQKLIETRGEGGYGLAPGSPAACHPSGHAYEYEGGLRLWELPTLAAHERDILVGAARALDRRPPPAAPKPHQPRGTGLRPGDDFDRRADWADVLGPHGWTVFKTCGDVAYWTRPGKDGGISATTGKVRGGKGEPLLHVFTSNAEPLDPERNYGPFNAYALLNHGGSHKDAAAALAAAGYGEQREGPTPARGEARGADGKEAKAPKADGWVLHADDDEIAAGSDLDMPDMGELPGGPSVFRVESLGRVLDREYPEPKYAVHGLLSEGLNILAGPPKLGKSMLALNLALTVAGDGRAMGDRAVNAGDVLYLSLEDQARRVKDRSRKMLEGLTGVAREDARRRLFVVTAWQRQDRGGLAMIDAWVKSRRSPSLVIIDVWNRYCPTAKGNANAYSHDADAMALVKTLADARGITVLVIHHTRKGSPGSGKSEDFVAEVSGTLGLAGTADGILVMVRERGGNQAQLFHTGRDSEEGELVVEFDPKNLVWKSLGTAKDHMAGRVQQSVIRYLTLRGAVGASCPEIAEAIGEGAGSIRVALNRMLDARIVTKKGNVWRCPPDDDAPESL